MHYNSPVFPQTLNLLFSGLDLTAKDLILDVGCGRGEMLATLLETYPCRGLGIDPKEHEIAVARERTKSLPDRARFQAVKLDDAQLPDEPLAMVVCSGSSHAFGGPGVALEKTLEWALKHVRPGGWVFLGEGFWAQPPHADYLAATGMAANEHTSLAETVNRVEALGMIPHRVVVSSPTEWDCFEGSFWNAAEMKLAASPDDADCRAAAEHWRGWRRAYHRWGRDTLGFVFLLLRTPASR